MKRPTPEERSATAQPDETTDHNSRGTFFGPDAGEGDRPPRYSVRAYTVSAELGAAPSVPPGQTELANCTTHVCVPCAVASSEGWWGRWLPPRFTHCRDCHTSFPGSNRFGHCSRCHQSFSGLDAFDSHQRTSNDRDFTPDCLCSTYRDAPGKESTNDVPSDRSWKVSAAVVLVLHDAEWGSFWSRDRDLAGVFAGGS